MQSQKHLLTDVEVRAFMLPVKENLSIETGERYSLPTSSRYVGGAP